MAAHLPAHEDHFRYAARYGSYVGRVGALAVALGIGAAIATGHGLGVGVAYATEGDQPADTSQDENTKKDDDGTETTPPPPGATVAPSDDAKPRSPLARIANVPKMIFNASGGAQTSTAKKTQPRLPRLSNVFDDITSTVTKNLTKLPAPAKDPAPQGSPNADPVSPLISPSAVKTDSHTLRPVAASLPAPAVKAIDNVKALVTAPARVHPKPAPTFSPNTDAPKVVERQALVTNVGQTITPQPTAARVLAPTTPPAPIDPVGVVTRLVTVALSGLVSPGPAAPTDPPLLLGVLAWARREFQLNFFNRTPNAIPDVVETSEDNPYEGNVLTNDQAQNPDGATEKLIVTNPGTYEGDKGTLVLNADGTYQYTPNADAYGQDTFTYTVSDEESRPHIHGLSGLLYGGGHTDTATLTINITPVNDAPNAGSGTLTVVEDKVKYATLPTATDIDTGDTLTYSITGAQQPTKGTVVITDAKTGAYTYTPNLNANGADSFQFTVTDGNGDTATGTVAVTITPVNDAPTTVPDARTISENAGPTVINVAANDVDGDNLTVTDTTAPSYGTVTFAGGTITYTPNANANALAAGETATDIINYTVSDGNGGIADGVLTITITGANDAPTLATPLTDQTATVDHSFNLNTASAFTDVDTGDKLTYSASGLPPGMTINTETGVISGTPTTTGTYKVTVTATDDSHEYDSSEFDITVNSHIGNDEAFDTVVGFQPNTLIAVQVKVCDDVTVTDLALITQFSTGHVTMALYTDSAGEPDQLVVATDSTALSGGAQEIAVTPSALQPGTYWIVTIFDQPTNVRQGSGGTGYRAQGLPYGEPLPDPFGSSTSPNSSWAINYYMVVVDEA